MLFATFMIRSFSDYTMIAIVFFLLTEEEEDDGVIVLCKIYLLFLFMRCLFFWQRSIKWKSMPAILMVDKSDVTMDARPLFCFLPHSINWLWHFIAVGKLFNSLIIRIKWFAVAIDDAFCPTILSTAYLRFAFARGATMNPCQKHENHPPHAHAENS